MIWFQCFDDIMRHAAADMWDTSWAVMTDHVCLVLFALYIKLRCLCCFIFPLSITNLMLVWPNSYVSPPHLATRIKTEIKTEFKDASSLNSTCMDEKLWFQTLLWSVRLREFRQLKAFSAVWVTTEDIHQDKVYMKWNCATW